MKFKALAIGLALQFAVLSPPASASYLCDGSNPTTRGDFCQYNAICESGGSENPSVFGAEIDCKRGNGACPAMNSCYKRLTSPDDVKDLCTKFGNDCWEDDIPTKDLPKGYSHK